MPKRAKILYDDIGFAKVDCHRLSRRGFPEVIFGKGKTPGQIVDIAKKIVSHHGILLVTKTEKKVYLKLKKIYPKKDIKGYLIYLDSQEVKEVL